jgi:hypothetical protein
MKVNISASVGRASVELDAPPRVPTSASDQRFEVETHVGGDAEKLRDHDHRERDRQVGHQIGGAIRIGVLQVVDQIVADVT